MAEQRLLPNGNIEITIELLPEIYAELRECMKRDEFTASNLINAAIGVFNKVSKLAMAQGSPLGKDIASTDENSNRESS